jgi:D-xylose transport system permease protein
MTTTPQAEVLPATTAEHPSGRHALLEATRRARTADRGILPILAALAVIAIAFQLLNHRFLAPINLTNLLLQVTSTGLIALGIYLVLLIGEIDLSVGSVSGLTAAIFAVLSVSHRLPAVVGLLAALAAGAAIGLLQGMLFTRFAVPSFVVTLAGLIGWQGLQLQVLGGTGTINLPPSLVTALTDTYLQHPVAWVVAVGAGLAVTAARFHDATARRGTGLPAPGAVAVLLRVAPVWAALIVSVAVLNTYRGVPLAAVVLVGLVIVFDQLTRHTRFGRHVLAVGGNSEAARRAGVRVRRVRVAVFTVCGLMAAAGGIFAASRLISVNQSSGGGDVLLNAIAAVVIGGTSLFGGRGYAWSALLGMLVIGAISNGMDLLGLSSATKFMITGAVLLLAVITDSVSRHGGQTAGTS